VKAQQLDVSATDLDISVSSDHSYEVVKEGELAVPAKHLHEIVKFLPENEALLKRAAPRYLEVKGAAAEFPPGGALRRRLPGPTTDVFVGYSSD
jgi:DNA polymerase-3 subunit beta